MTITAAAALVQAPPKPDLAAVKTRQQAAWGSGNYAVIGTTLQIVGESLCEAADIRADERVLDVAAGNGNASLAAARRFASVTSTDYVPSLLNSARMRADAEGLTLEFREADAENLGFGDDSFDVVLSTFGVMFTPDQERAASGYCVSYAPAAALVWRTGRRRASSGSCSRRWANTCRRHPA